MDKKPFFKRHPKLALLLFNLLILLFIAAVFEVYLRVNTPQWLQIRMDALQTGNYKDFGSDGDWKVEMKDGEFYSFTPNSNFMMYAFEYEKPIHINNLGGRATSPNEVIDKKGLVPFTGDSFVFGVGVDDSESVVALAKRKTGFNFLNLGVTGTGLHFQRKMIDKRYAELGKPATVVFGFYSGNDFADIMREVMQDSAEAKADLQKVVTETKTPSSKTFLWKVNYFINQNVILKRSYFLQFVKAKILSLKNKGDSKVMENIFYVMDRDNKEYLAAARSALEKEAQALSKEPYRSVVVLFPDREQVYERLRKTMCDYYGLDEKKMDAGLPNKILSEVLEKYHIPYIDATNCLLQHRDDGPLYYTQDNHLTALGQQIFTSCIADKLKNIVSEEMELNAGSHGTEGTSAN